MKIEMNVQLLAKLIKEGAITPSQVRCLDEPSKQALRKLCLKLCQPSQCARCDAQSYCLLDKELTQESSQNLYPVHALELRHKPQLN